MKAATPGHVPREQRVGRASMKGRPINSGDLNPPSGIGNGYAPQ